MKLCRYNVNFTDQYTTMQHYIEKMKKEQNKIYYILANTRQAALASPFYEPFKGTDVPVIILNIHVDEMVNTNINNQGLQINKHL